MLRTPLIWARATSGIEINASGSIGVPGTKRTRGSRCAWLTSAGSRRRAAHPVIRPQPRLRLLTEAGAARPAAPALVESYRRCGQCRARLGQEPKTGLRAD